MQEKNKHFASFRERTDALAVKKCINVQELTAVLNISHSNLFSCRSGNRPISTKTWSKLEAAEKAAGIFPDLPQPPPAPAPGPQQPSISNTEEQLLEEIRTRVGQYRNADAMRRALLAKQITTRLAEYGEWCDAHHLDLLETKSATI